MIGNTNVDYNKEPALEIVTWGGGLRMRLPQ